MQVAQLRERLLRETGTITLIAEVYGELAAC